ncbi:ATP-binding protein [Ruminococcus sp.]|uniref:ATP-binding protein n=1 Tax=Ruminococcus sp. TaxID=41978 RepID=UPI00388D603E
MKRLEIPAEKARLTEVIGFVLDYAEKLGFEKKELFQIKLCTEEVFVNVASYAYGADTGMITVIADGSEEPLTLTLSFIDSGMPFDPLAKPDPAKKRPLSQAKKGGLGIFLTKRFMDEVSYAYQDGRNILTISKKHSKAESGHE